MTVVGLVDGPIAILAAFTLAMMALSPMLSLSDAYALSGLGARGRSYGPVRLWGSVAFIAGNVGAGFLLEAIAPGHLIWLIVFALMLVVAAAAALTPLDGVRLRPKSGSAGAVAEDPAAQSGVSRGGAGVEHGAGQPRALLRLLDHAMARRRPRRHADRRCCGGSASRPRSCCLRCRGGCRRGSRPTTLLAIGGLGAIVRWTAMAFDPPTAMLPALQLLHAASFGAAHLGMMGFLARAVPRELAATAQGFAATWSGIVNASATFASGFVYAASGSLAYLLMAAMALVGLSSALYAGRLWQDKGD